MAEYTTSKKIFKIKNAIKLWIGYRLQGLFIECQIVAKKRNRNLEEVIVMLLNDIEGWDDIVIKKEAASFAGLETLVKSLSENITAEILVHEIYKTCAREMIKRMSFRVDLDIVSDAIESTIVSLMCPKKEIAEEIQKEEDSDIF